MSGARFVRELKLELMDNAGERQVAEALQKGLDQEWTIYCNYHLLRKDAHLKEGEVDFVLLHRRHGMLVLEVKGGQLEYDPDLRQWWQNGYPMDDPFAQARGNTHDLRKQILERGRFPRAGGFPCTFGYAVAFPECNYLGTLPPGAQGSVLYSLRDLPHLGERVRDTLRDWSRDQKSSQMHPSDFEQIKTALQSTFHLVTPLSHCLKRDEEALVQLTESQARALARIFANPRVKVQGTAGSGKTMLALHRALAFAREGRSTLLLCYNKSLPFWLRRQVGDQEGLKVINFHSLCFELCSRAGIEFVVPKEDAADFWRYRSAEGILDALARVDERYDAIVVDEAQDFHDEWWVAIEALGRVPNGPLYLFFDPDQNLFDTGMEFPEGMLYVLDENCRNTRSIARICGQVLGQDIKSPPGTPDGCPPEVTVYSDDEELRRSCQALLKRLLDQERLRPSQVALLSRRKPANSALAGERLGKYALTQDVEAWLSDRAVWFSSIRAFKGMEAEVMVLVEVDELAPPKWDRPELFVACSRARHRLYVLASSEQARRGMLQ